MSLSEEENIQIQYNVLGYSIDLHFYDYKLAIETDENDQWCRWMGNPGQKPQNGRTKFPNLLILEHLKSCFIEPSK